MKRFTITLTAAAVVLAAATLADAGKGNGNGGGNHRSGPSGNAGISFRKHTGGGVNFQSQVVQHRFQSNHVNTQANFRHPKIVLNNITHGRRLSIAHCPTTCWKKCDFGYCFPSKACCHWEYKYWVPACGFYAYYCPYTYIEYWYCVEDDCYYPKGYCPIAYRAKYTFVW
jgi:hypothetical protein